MTIDQDGTGLRDQGFEGRRRAESGEGGVPGRPDLRCLLSRAEPAIEAGGLTVMMFCCVDEPHARVLGVCVHGAAVVAHPGQQGCLPTEERERDGGAGGRSASTEQAGNEVRERNWIHSDRHNPTKSTFGAAAALAEMPSGVTSKS
jgi:hypothetical protein